MIQDDPRRSGNFNVLPPPGNRLVTIAGMSTAAQGRQIGPSRSGIPGPSLRFAELIAQRPRAILRRTRILDCRIHQVPGSTAYGPIAIGFQGGGVFFLISISASAAISGGLIQSGRRKVQFPHHRRRRFRKTPEHLRARKSWAPPRQGL